MHTYEFLEKIGFSKEMINEYKKYSKIYNKRLDRLAELTVSGNIAYSDAYKIAEDFEPNIHRYTAHLMFVIECAGYLLKKYRENHIPDEMFYTAMKDIGCKLNECINVEGIFGTFVVHWYESFFNLKRLAFGRLQYDIIENSQPLLEFGKYQIKDAPIVLGCHIPGLGPLKHDKCIESYKMAYEYFKEKLHGNPLVIKCGSWLLLPEFEECFKESSKNICDFRNDFYVYEVKYQDEFLDSWRVFNTRSRNYEDLPKDNRLRKSFSEYMKKGGKYGSGSGLLLFDGKKCLTP